MRSNFLGQTDRPKSSTLYPSASRGITYFTIFGCEKFSSSFSIDTSRITDMGIPSSVAVIRIFFMATISPFSSVALCNKKAHYATANNKLYILTKYN